MRVLVTGPALRDPGGVSAYYNAVLPELRKGPDAVTYLEIGGTLRRGGAGSPIIDQWQFGRALARDRPDLYLCNPSLDPKSFVRDGLFVWQAARRGIPVLVFFHGWRLDFADRVERRWQRLFRRSFGRARGFIVLASAFRDRLRSWGVRAPITLGMTAVASELLQGFSIGDVPRNRPDQSVRILFLARLERAKGILETLAAFNALRERGLSVTLTVAGDGGARGDVQAFLAAHPAAAAHIRVEGDVRGERKRELFASHDLYCFPSYTEGMPTSVLEAMAFGLPVVASAVGGLRDIFEEGRMGRLLPRVDAAAVADALEALATDPVSCERIGRYNLAYAQQHCVAPASAARLQSVIRSVLGEP